MGGKLSGVPDACDAFRSSWHSLGPRGPLPGTSSAEVADTMIKAIGDKGSIEAHCGRRRREEGGQGEVTPTLVVISPTGNRHRERCVAAQGDQSGSLGGENLV